MSEENNPFNPGYYNTDELKTMGFGAIGDNVMIAKDAKIIGRHNVYIGNNVRIDGLTTISAHHAPFRVGNYVHIAGYCFINCGAEIVMDDFSGLSQRVSLYGSSDDYSGISLTNPTVPSGYTNVKKAPITIGKHAIIGSGAVVLPGVNIGIGCAVGALSLVVKSLDDWGVYAGAPVKRVKDRSQHILQLEKEFLKTS